MSTPPGADLPGDLGKLPARLSPSRASDFLTCPRVFYVRTICGLESDQSVASVRGTLTHAVLERVFDLPEGARSPTAAQSLIPVAWAALTTDDDRAAEYLQVVAPGSAEEAEMFSFVATMVENWFAMEHVNAFSPTGLVLTDGRVLDGRELHVTGPVLGGGAVLHGFIDRLDSWQPASGPAHWAVSDYKTGKVPGAGSRYPLQVRRAIADQAFFALKIYALLCRETLGVTPNRARLIYLATGSRDEGIKTLRLTDATLDATLRDVRQLWEDIVAAARTSTWTCSNSRLCRYKPHEEPDAPPVRDQPAA